jgi:hypothetical protein
VVRALAGVPKPSKQRAPQWRVANLARLKAGIRALEQGSWHYSCQTVSCHLLAHKVAGRDLLCHVRIACKRTLVLGAAEAGQGTHGVFGAANRAHSGRHSKDADVDASMLLQNDRQSPLNCVCLIRFTFYFDEDVLLVASSARGACAANDHATIRQLSLLCRDYEASVRHGALLTVRCDLASKSKEAAE